MAWLASNVVKLAFEQAPLLFHALGPLNSFFTDKTTSHLSSFPLLPTVLSPLSTFEGGLSSSDPCFEKSRLQRTWPEIQLDEEESVTSSNAIDHLWKKRGEEKCWGQMWMRENERSRCE